MIPDSEIIELKKILTSEYKVELSLDEVRRMGESLVNIYSVILNNNQRGSAHET